MSKIFTDEVINKIDAYAKEKGLGYRIAAEKLGYNGGSASIAWLNKRKREGGPVKVVKKHGPKTSSLASRLTRDLVAKIQFESVSENKSINEISKRYGFSGQQVYHARSEFRKKDASKSNETYKEPSFKDIEIPSRPKPIEETKQTTSSARMILISGDASDVLKALETIWG